MRWRWSHLTKCALRMTMSDEVYEGVSKVWHLMALPALRQSIRIIVVHAYVGPTCGWDHICRRASCHIRSCPRNFLLLRYGMRSIVRVRAGYLCSACARSLLALVVAGDEEEGDLQFRLCQIRSSQQRGTNKSAELTVEMYLRHSECRNVLVGASCNHRSHATWCCGGTPEVLP